MSGDYISRDYLLGEYDRQHQGPPGGARKIIAEAPAADVVEVVRCRECVHCCGVSGEPPFEEAYEAYCGEHDWYVSETFFCADGKRMDGGQDDV